MKIITKIVDRLYRKYGSRDVVEMTRLQLQGVKLRSDEFDFSALPPHERNYLAGEARNLLENEVFKMAVELVKDRFLRHIAYKAQDDMQIFCDRFSINGVSEIESELKRISGLTDEKEQKADSPHELFD